MTDQYHNNEAQKEILINLSIKYRQEGWSLRDIAKIIKEEHGLKISHTMVKNYILVGCQRFADENKDLVKEYFLKNMKRLDRNIEIAQMEVDRSIGGIKKVTTTEKYNSETGKFEVVDRKTEKQERLASAELMRVAESSIDKQNRMLNIYDDEETLKKEGNGKLDELIGMIGQVMNHDEEDESEDNGQQAENNEDL